MTRTRRETLTEARHHLDYLDRYASLDLTQDLVIDAIALRLAALIDVLGRLPEEDLDELFGASWKAMRGLRNRIAHGYHSVTAEVLRVTVTEEVPDIRERIQRQLAD